MTDKPDQVNVNKNEAETAERRERNRYSARRSRIRKQRHYDELEKTQKVLMFENANLRLDFKQKLNYQEFYFIKLNSKYFQNCRKGHIFFLLNC